MFQPNIIIDARLGCMWEVELKLEVLVSMMADKVFSLFSKFVFVQFSQHDYAQSFWCVLL